MFIGRLVRGENVVTDAPRLAKTVSVMSSCRQCGSMRRLRPGDHRHRLDSRALCGHFGKQDSRARREASHPIRHGQGHALAVGPGPQDASERHALLLLRRARRLARDERVLQVRVSLTCPVASRCDAAARASDRTFYPGAYGRRLRCVYSVGGGFVVNDKTKGACSIVALEPALCSSVMLSRGSSSLTYR